MSSRINLSKKKLMYVMMIDKSPFVVLLIQKFIIIIVDNHT